MDPIGKPRIMWVDVAKGIGVYLVFIGHMWYACTPQIFLQFIYSFHVPFFFVLSGFVFDVGKKSQDFFGFVLSKAKRLLLPIVIFNFVCALLFIPTKWEELGIIGFLNEIFCFRGSCFFNKPSWFFLTLFEIYVLMYLLRISQMGLRAKTVLMLLFALAGFFVAKYDVVLYLGIDRVLITASFFILGSIARSIYEKKRIPPWGHYIIIVVSVIALILFGMIVNERVSINFRIFGYYPAFLLAGISGSICFCYLSRLISNLCRRLSKHLVGIGRDSVFIIGTHHLLTFVFCQIGIVKGIAYTWYFSVIAILLTVVLIVEYHRICEVLDSRIPWLTGKAKKQTKN